MAKILNEQFCSVFNREIKGGDQINLIDNGSQGKVLDNIQISIEDVEKTISKFKMNN